MQSSSPPFTLSSKSEFLDLSESLDMNEVTMKADIQEDKLTFWRQKWSITPATWQPHAVGFSSLHVQPSNAQLPWNCTWAIKSLQTKSSSVQVGSSHMKEDQYPYAWIQTAVGQTYCSRSNINMNNSLCLTIEKSSCWYLSVAFLCWVSR